MSEDHVFEALLWEHWLLGALLHHRLAVEVVRAPVTQQLPREVLRALLALEEVVVRAVVQQTRPFRRYHVAMLGHHGVLLLACQRGDLMCFVQLATRSG